MPLDARQQRLLRLIAANLRAGRARADLSQDEVAHRAGFTNQSVVSQLERGIRPSSIVKYVEAAWAIGMAPEELFRDIEDARR